MNYCKQETMVKERWFIAISFCLALDNILFSGAITKVLRVDFDETYRISENLILIV